MGAILQPCNIARCSGLWLWSLRVLLFIGFNVTQDLCSNQFFVFPGRADPKKKICIGALLLGELHQDIRFIKGERHTPTVIYTTMAETYTVQMAPPQILIVLRMLITQDEEGIMAIRAGLGGQTSNIQIRKQRLRIFINRGGESLGSLYPVTLHNSQEILIQWILSQHLHSSCDYKRRRVRPLRRT